MWLHLSVPCRDSLNTWYGEIDSRPDEVYSGQVSGVEMEASSPSLHALVALSPAHIRFHIVLIIF
jgi:hypothetical protein